METIVEDKVKQFSGQGRLVLYQKDQLVVPAGQEPAGVMWLVSGVVEQYALTKDGARISVNLFKPPAFFPMSWAINRTANDYFYVAATDVELKLTNVDEAVLFLRDNPDVLFDLLGRVYRGTDGLLHRLALAGARVATDRLVFELITECYRFGKQIDEHVWHISITQAALASRCALARETVSRELQKLSQEKLVSLKRGGMDVNVPDLEKVLVD